MGQPYEAAAGWGLLPCLWSYPEALLPALWRHHPGLTAFAQRFSRRRPCRDPGRPPPHSRPWVLSRLFRQTPPAGTHLQTCRLRDDHAMRCAVVPHLCFPVPADDECLVHRRGETFSTASFEEMTGYTSNSIISFHLVVHSSSRLRSPVSISWKQRSSFSSTQLETYGNPSGVRRPRSRKRRYTGTGF